MHYHSPNSTGKPLLPPPRRGAVLAIMPFMIVMMLALAMLMVDLGYVFSTRSGLQNAADAAGLAAALRLREPKSKPKEIRQLAIEFANHNQPDVESVLTPGDVEIGEWDFENKSFSAGGAEPNAVRVTVRRDGVQSTSLVLFFSKVFGVDEIDMSVASVTAFETYTLESGEEFKTMPYLVN